MKTTLKIVRGVILREMAMVSVNQAEQRGLALRVDKTKLTITLYDPSDFWEAFSSALRGGYNNATSLPKRLEVSSTAVVGAIELNEPEHGVYVVASSAADKGYGPLLYDIAMSVFGRIAPDRGSVSAPARAMWKKYQQRQDITKEPLGKKFSQHGEEHLDQAIRGANVNVSQLIARHDALVSRISATAKKLGINGDIAQWVNRLISTQRIDFLSDRIAAGERTNESIAGNDWSNGLGMASPDVAAREHIGSLAQDEEDLSPHLMDALDDDEGDEVYGPVPPVNGSKVVAHNDFYTRDTHRK